MMRILDVSRMSIEVVVDATKTTTTTTTTTTT